MTFRFPLTDDWLQLTQTDAVGHRRAWATRAVDELAERTGEGKARGHEPYIAHLEAIADHYVQLGGLGCLLLTPEAQLPVKEMVRLELFAGPADDEGWQRQCELFLPPHAWLLDPVSVTKVATGAGEATRIEVRAADPDEEAAPVRHNVTWLWWLRDVPQTFMASVALAHVSEAPRWLPEIDRMMASALRPDGTTAAPGVMPTGDYAG